MPVNSSQWSKRLYSYNDADFIWVGSQDPNWVGWQYRAFPIEFTTAPLTGVGIKNDRNPTGTRFALFSVASMTKKSFALYFFSGLGDPVDIENIYTEHSASVIIIGH